MSAKTWMFACGTAGVIGLGVGLPVVALSTGTPMTTVTGTVTGVDVTHRVVVLRVDATADPTAPALAVQVPRRLDVDTPAGPEPLARLGHGQTVRARIRTGGEHRASWIRLARP